MGTIAALFTIIIIVYIFKEIINDEDTNRKNK